MKVLIIKYGALGDIIMATSVIERIREHYSGEQLWLLTEPAFARLFENWPGLAVQSFSRKGLRSTLQTLRWIRARSFDRLIDLQSNDRSGILCALSGVPDRAGNHPRYPYHRHPPDRYSGQCHAHTRLNEILAACDIAPAEAAPHLPATGEVRRRVQEWLAGRGLEASPLVLLHAGASRRHPRKRWPGFARLARELDARGFVPVWIGGPDDRDLNRELSAQVGVDAGDGFPVLELAELGRHARFAVTNDSAPMHILSCSGIPVYGLFGPTDWRRTHALGQGHNVISSQEETGTGFRPESLDHLSVSKVLSRLQADGVVDQS
ncbi:MAG: glycosyltransferase family 9 protein [Gammaproteobacteria bacterium]